MSRRLPALTPRTVIQAIERAGFVLYRVRGSHHHFIHPDRPELLVTVPYHNRDMRVGTLARSSSRLALRPTSFWRSSEPADVCADPFRIEVEPDGDGCAPTDRRLEKHGGATWGESRGWHRKTSGRSSSWLSLTSSRPASRGRATPCDTDAPRAGRPGDAPCTTVIMIAPSCATYGFTGDIHAQQSRSTGFLRDQSGALRAGVGSPSLAGSGLWSGGGHHGGGTDA